MRRAPLTPERVAHAETILWPIAQHSTNGYARRLATAKLGELYDETGGTFDGPDPLEAPDDIDWLDWHPHG